MEEQSGDTGCVIVKFGGSSLSDSNAIMRAARSVVEEWRRGVNVVVVVSAMKDTTDNLLSIADESCDGRVKPEDLDDIVSMGERTSARIFTAAVKSLGVEAAYLDPDDPEWPIITDESFSRANPITSICEERIRRAILPLLNRGVIVVVPGFIGKTVDGKVTTMGRGGSDTTAMILARALRADQVILVTDVDGIMTADPKIIDNPRILSEVDMDVLAGLADSGSKFIHKKALKYKSADIDVKVINNARGDLRSDGTLIKGYLPENLIVESYPGRVMAVTIIGKALSESPETLQVILQQIRMFKATILGMSINHNSLILYLPMDGFKELLESLHSMILAHERMIAMAVKQNLAFITVKGVGLEETPGIISSISKRLFSAGINIYGIFTITSSILLFIDLKSRDEALRLINDSIQNFKDSGKVEDQ